MKKNEENVIELLENFKRDTGYYFLYPEQDPNYNRIRKDILDNLTCEQAFEKWNNSEITLNELHYVYSNC